MKRVYISSEKTTAPLSGAYEVGELVFVSGQIHVDASGQLVGDSIEEKLEAIISNVKKVLGEAELTLEDVVKVQMYLTDLSWLPNLNKAYVNYFKQPLPARTAIGVAALPLGASLEMDVIAARK